MPSEPKKGPLSATELQELWRSVTDRTYNEPLILGGDGSGLEIHGQAFAQFARVSLSVDRTTQALYILPSSGQTDEPAGGPALATVVLTLTRATRFDQELSFYPGLFWVGEQTEDHGDEGAETFETGRRYSPTHAVTMMPGQASITATFVAERPGYGYNLPLPGTIRDVTNDGTGLDNVGASISTAWKHRLQVKNDPDVVVPQNVGQYIELTAGSNTGQVRQVAGYEGPQPFGSPPHGGVALLQPRAVYRISASTGTFTLGEEVFHSASGVRSYFLAQDSARIILDSFSNTVQADYAVGNVLVGQASGATATVSSIEQSFVLTSETMTAAWKVLDWVDDFGFAVTNVLSPTGGRAGMLDEIGRERKVYRSPGETDDNYRARIHTPADVVTPNALQRAANRVLTPYGLTGCLREVGLEKFRGMFYDGDPSDTDPVVAFAYDQDARVITGAGSALFYEGELVYQPATGAVGHAIVNNVSGPGVGSVTAVAGVYGPAFQPLGASSIRPLAFRAGITKNAATVSTGLRDDDRYKLNLDYEEFRAFFVVGLKSVGGQEFGYSFDSAYIGHINAFDATGYGTSFLDGFPLTEAIVYRSVWDAENDARAGGVGFELIQDEGACT